MVRMFVCTIPLIFINRMASAVKTTRMCLSGDDGPAGWLTLGQTRPLGTHYIRCRTMKCQDR